MTVPLGSGRITKAYGAHSGAAEHNDHTSLSNCLNLSSISYRSNPANKYRLSGFAVGRANGEDEGAKLQSGPRLTNGSFQEECERARMSGIGARSGLENDRIRKLSSHFRTNQTLDTFDRNQCPPADFFSRQRAIAHKLVDCRPTQPSRLFSLSD